MLDEAHQLFFECSKCHHKATFYRGLYQAETGELFVAWRCIKCRGSCMAIIAGMKPVNPFFNEKDVDFLHELGVAP